MNFVEWVNLECAVLIWGSNWPLGVRGLASLELFSVGTGRGRGGELWICIVLQAKTLSAGFSLLLTTISWMSPSLLCSEKGKLPACTELFSLLSTASPTLCRLL